MALSSSSSSASPTPRPPTEAPIPATLLPITPLPVTSETRRRELTLNEYDSDTGQPMVMLLNRLPWHAPVTEIAKLDSTEVWSFVNLTEDTHPIHLHHVRFQVLDRRPFDRDRYLLQHADLRFTGPAQPPRPPESGWKDVVQCPPTSSPAFMFPSPATPAATLGTATFRSTKLTT